MKTLVGFVLMSDLTYICRIDQRLVYAYKIPVPIWPESIYGALYFAETIKLFIEIVDMPDIGGSLSTYLKRLYLSIRVDFIAQGHHIPHPHAFLLGGCDLIAKRSTVTSRSNWVKDIRTLSVNRSIEEEILKDCVTETKEQPLASKTINELCKVRQRPCEPIYLIDYDRIYQTAFYFSKQSR